MKCCVRSHSQIEDWTSDQDIPQTFDDQGICTEEPTWEVKEGGWDWKPICTKHYTVFSSHGEECPEVRFRPVFYVIDEEFAL